MRFIASLLLLICIQLCAAFSPSIMGKAPTLRSPKGMTTTCMLQGADAAAKNAVSAALVGAILATSPTFTDAATAANPYAKSTDVEVEKKTLTKEEKEAKKSSNAALIAVPLVGGLALSYPFFKRSVERMGEKAQGKR
eukprot:CAMPEP_0181319808 /NCGR_PEP_ID=MMETSP1101-20121128/17775_1 /TAXON_ID=46948 /ORGANISM="Rhodomonas abbreviata, Strain Caron Lab Isolate" /LENGTH=137 /DNA_ID=CAMNT_0023427445 /DNA_START=21 /DNA_END=434 /DNA_ORIENTATION=-